MNNATLDDIGSLCVLHAIVATGSLTRAAQRLGLSKGAVSTRLSAFERTTGVLMLNRSTRVVTPTDAGRRLAGHAERMLRIGAEGLEEISAEGLKPGGLLRVTAPVAIGRQLVAPHLAGFLDRYRDVELELELTDSIVSLPGRACDIAIRHTATPPDSFMVWPLRQVGWRLVASPAYLARAGTPHRPEDLPGHACVFYLRGDRIADWSFARGDSVVTARVSGRCLANNSEVLRELVLGGVGIGLLPDYSCAAECADGRLVPVLGDWRVAGTFADMIVAARPWTARVSPAARAFVEHLRDRLRL